MLEIKFLDGFMPSIGDQFDVLDFAQFNGDFDTFVTPTLSEGFWDFSSFSETGTFSVTAVPEPGAFFILAMCGATAAIRTATEGIALEAAKSNGQRTLIVTSGRCRENSLIAFHETADKRKSICSTLFAATKLSSCLSVNAQPWKPIISISPKLVSTELYTAGLRLASLNVTLWAELQNHCTHSGESCFA